MDEQIYFAVSTDGYYYTDLNHCRPVLESHIGERGVRDPYLMRSAEGDKFYLLATDLSIYYRGGWGSAKATTTGSRDLIIWESTDLVNWSEPRAVAVGTEDAGCAWAPEAIYNEETGEYVVYFAQSHVIDGALDKDLRIFVTTTRDFISFSEAQEYIYRADDRSIIDTSMILAEDGYYYRASADGQITLERSRELFGEWEKVTILNDLGFDQDMTGSRLEGPELIRFNKKDWIDGKATYGLFTDQYAEGKGYLPVVTTNLNDADNSGHSWKKLSAGEYSFDMLKKRHGTILNLTQSEYERIMEAYGTNNKEPVEKPEDGILADFDFNDRENGFNGGIAIAEANGSVRLDAHNDGKALYLDGSTWLDVTDTNGASLLTDCSEITISYDARPDRTDTNWILYAAPDAASPVYKSERYFGILANNGTTTAERYNNDGEWPENPSAETGDTWVHVDVVVSEASTAIYVDGIQQSLANSSCALEQILGKNSILMIGKANWGSGEYCRGWIDNLKIQNRALTEREIAEEQGISFCPIKEVKGEGLSIIKTVSDAENKRLTVYVGRNQSSADFVSAELSFQMAEGTYIENEKKAYDISKPLTLIVNTGDHTEEWMAEFTACSNPVLSGEFADPDIALFQDKYYIYPTTDGVSGWGGYQFHVFSSEDLVNWEDEGIILDLKAENSYKNEKGVDVAVVPWSDGNAWAPAIEEKDGSYYFYFCGNDRSTGNKAIGVAVADSPVGPFTVKETPLLTLEQCKIEGISMGQVIDPSVFTEDDGTSYLLFGNGYPAIVQLSSSMTSWRRGTMKNYAGATGFREAITVTKREGTYHFTWSQDDTGSENYQVNYGVSQSLYGPITYKYPILQKDKSRNILGTGHHSILYIPQKDMYYIACHRFLTPLGQVDGGFGYHREVCIDRLDFEDGLMQKVTPTLTGITEPVWVGKKGRTVITVKTFNGKKAKLKVTVK